MPTADDGGLFTELAARADALSSRLTEGIINFSLSSLSFFVFFLFFLFYLFYFPYENRAILNPRGQIWLDKS